ncbi:MAG: DMT family transporter [Spirochaetales bacterium]|nr:DMT family transporter [Spirochaetales bacterium]
MKKDSGYIIFLVLVMFIWGGSWASGKLVTSSAPAAVIVFWRFLLTTIAVTPFVFVFRQKLKISAAQAAWLATGGFLLFMYNVLFFSGLHTGLAGAGGVLVTTLNPILTYILTVILFREKAKPVQLVALAIGLAGGLIMLEIWKVSLDDLLKSGNLLFLFASLLWGFVTLLSGRMQKQIHFIVYSFYVYLFCSVIALAVSLVNGNITSLPADIPFWLNILYLSVGVTALATTFYFVCTAKLGSRRASSFIFMVPLSAVFISWLLLGEVPTLVTIVGGGLAVTAVLVINWNR